MVKLKKHHYSECQTDYSNIPNETHHRIPDKNNPCRFAAIMPSPYALWLLPVLSIRRDNRVCNPCLLRI